ncbi:MAG: tetratricopeptide repeat protein [Acidobacteriota bacterium]
MSGGILAVFLGGLLLAADLESAAREAVDTQNFWEARELYIHLSEQNPASLNYLLWIGRLSAWLNDYPTATRFYDRALAREPQNADALVGKAYVLMWQQEFQGAHELLSQAQLRIPERTDLLLALARYYYYQGRTTEALEQIERLFTVDPENSDGRELKSQITLSPLAAKLEKAAGEAVDTKNFGEARQLYIQLSEQNPASLNYLLWIGRLSSWLNDYATATRFYDRALAREPRNVDALVGKAYVLMWQQEFQAAHEFLSQAQLMTPERTDVLLALARYYQYQGRNREALEQIERVFTVAPESSEARELKSQIILPRSLEVRLGWGQEGSSIASPASKGYVSVGYVGDRGRVSGHYERWNGFDEKINRGGLSFSRQLADRFWLRGYAMLAPGATVLAAQDYTAGFSRALPRGMAVGADYRYLRFEADQAHVLAPLFEYYFERPAWVRAVFYKSWTKFQPSGVVDSNEAFMLHYYQQITQPMLVNVGFAHGSESFSPLSVDRIGQFVANTYFGGVDFKLTPAYSVGLHYSYQGRSDGNSQNTFGIGLTIRE